jgi:hypothetical protein
VSSTGGKVWYVSARINERVRRIKIGSYPVVGLADARDKARDILRRIQLGEFVEETPEVRLPTFGEMVPQFIELWSKPRNRAWRFARAEATRSKPTQRAVSLAFRVVSALGLEPRTP